MTLSDLLSPTSSSLLTGDYIGMESSVDVLKDCDDHKPQLKVTGSGGDGHDGSFGQRIRNRREQKWALKNKEFPPPIQLLARTENLPSHMPWVLKRHYTDDGRLILTEEKVKHHEYLRAHRSNGRLTLQLVLLDDEILIPPFACNGNENENENENENGDMNKNEIGNDVGDGGHDNNDDDGCEDDDEDDVVEDQKISGIGGSGASAGKCFSFNSVGTGSPCIFGVPVLPAIRHVRS
ncbi:hypothetical protein D8674_033822 [Pyrus ussuriensis x Pyrus communis]|uniref:FAF domain-containing protein n=1 Tax=Pyrus ussuriensis x Pyrus communis TaxID=2448454 RepID=A0A5N5HQB8_9ROSA|nr:hypothetical protein D8674_033822 [Pyrus ussuriensis x Pyrus communis]